MAAPLSLEFTIVWEATPRFYGAALPRFREEDFGTLEHEGGVSPSWPISYDELEPYYCRAETLYGVRGKTGEDPTDPARTEDYPHKAVPHEPQIASLAASLQKQGLHPFHLPLGIDLGGQCLRCHTCDGFPCKVHAKHDAEVCAVRPVIDHPNITLWTNSIARRIVVRDASVDSLELERGRQTANR